ncbi:MAG: lysophospholipid acyltransferase family protein [bacterium]
MNQKNRKRVRWLLEKLAPGEAERIGRLKIHDLGLGYDPFGLEIESAMLGYLLARFLYNYWFRVESTGVEHVPAEGPGLITPNHSGVLPLDGLMIAADLAKNMEEPRIIRAVADHFFGFLPFINTALYRCGEVVGARDNVEELLKKGELVCLFPEGARGTGKPFRERYRLRAFNVGFMELSLLHRVPVIPACVIGGEEQYQMLYNVKPLARMLDFPYFPITPLFPWTGLLGAIPLPTKYHIEYGEPFHFYRDYPPETVKDPEVVRMLVERVRQRVEDMVREGLGKRKGIFGLGWQTAGAGRRAAQEA